jgi:dTDP-4-dehydrorhamnose reductase
MKILILGASGMIGSNIYKFFFLKKKFELYGTYCTKTLNNHQKKNIKNRLIFFDISTSNLGLLINKTNPNVIINCIGITKKLINKFPVKKVFVVNSSFVNKLKKKCNKNNIKLIQISTDCVFDGKKGNYSEYSKPNATDVYGISKLKSEFISKKHLLIRTSTIGNEIRTKHGLLEWFLKKKLPCYGFCNAFFSGVTCLKFAEILFLIIKNLNKFNGIFHISGPKISKYELLLKIKKIYKKKIPIFKDYSFKIDRSLNNSKMISKIPEARLGLSWDNMLKKNLKFNKIKLNESL